MRIAARLLDHRRLRQAVQILKSGQVLCCSFQPLRRGALRLALGSNALEIVWHQTTQIIKVKLNGALLRLRNKKDHDILLSLAVESATRRIIQSRQDDEARLPLPFNIKMKRSLSVFAMRLGQAIRQSTNIADRRDPNGFGVIKVLALNFSIDLHVLEGGLLPTVQINRRDALTTSADVRYITRSIYTRLRQLRRHKPQMPQALAA